MADPGIGIGGRCAANIAALCIHNHQHAGIDRRPSQMLQQPHAVGPLLLKKCGLRFDRSDLANGAVETGRHKIANGTDGLRGTGLGHGIAE